MFLNTHSYKKAIHNMEKSFLIYLEMSQKSVWGSFWGIKWTPCMYSTFHNFIYQPQFHRNKVQFYVVKSGDIFALVRILGIQSYNDILISILALRLNMKIT